MSQKDWTPDVVVGVDFGMTSVAYSFGDEWARPETIQSWPGTPGNGLADKVNTAVAYDIRTHQVATWGFLVDDLNHEIRIEDNFKLFLDPNFEDDDRDIPSITEARQWFVDYLRCLYKSIMRYFRETIPKWGTRRVEFTFSVPTTWKDPAMVAKTERLIKDAGFGTETNHRTEITLTEAEAAAVCASKRVEKGDVFLVCDAGGGTTDVNILKVSESNSGQTELESLLCVEGRAIGSTLIDFRVENMLTERFEVIQHHLGAEPRVVAQRVMRDRFENFKCNFGTEAHDVPTLPLLVRDLPPGLDFPQAHISESKMIITKEQVQEIFDDQIEKICRLVDTQLKELQKNFAHETVSYMVLSGGLGSSPYVRKRLQNRYEVGTGGYANAQNLKIISAAKPQLAVVHGLVMDRIQQIRDRKLVYKERRCRNSYGVVCKQPYKPEYHQGEDVATDRRDGKTWAERQISWFIKQGEPVSVEKGVQHAFKRKMNPGQEKLPWRTQIVMSSLPATQLPISLKRDGAKPVCAVEALLKDNDMKLKNRHWYNRKPRYYLANFDVRVLIGSANLKFEIVAKDGSRSSSHEEIEVQWAATTKQEAREEIPHLSHGLEQAQR